MRREEDKTIKEKTKKKFSRKIKNGFVSFSKLIGWRNRRIGQKYLMSFAIAAILFIISGVIVYFQLSLAGEDISKFEEETLRTHDMAQMASLIQTKDVQIADYIITKNEKYIEEFEKLLDEFDKLEKKLEPNMRTDEQQGLFKLIQDNNNRINKTFYNVIDNNNIYSDDYLNSLRESSSSLRSSTVEATNMLIDMVFEEQNTTMESANQAISNSVLILVTTNIIAISIGVLIVILISRSITSKLNQVVDITTEVANGRLTVESMQYQGKDEIGQLASAIHQMKNNIRNILLKVTDASQSVSASSETLTQSAHEVNEGSNQIASTMQELSSGSETQADSASDLSESMSGFVDTVHASEQESIDVSKNSDHVLTLTNEGTMLMRTSVEQMKRIDSIVSKTVGQVQDLDKQSDEISQLVLVIQKVADQTNLLSLNAAIEAARAGDHGKGFAVVSNEIRKLADQVSVSVSEITSIVTNIQTGTDHVVSSLNKGYEEVKEGTEQIEKTGQNFEVINDSVSTMIEKIVSISTNLKNIANNSSHMNGLIQDIASVSEEAAAGVEQAAATTEETSSSMDEISNHANELERLAEQLNDEIGVFQLK